MTDETAQSFVAQPELSLQDPATANSAQAQPTTTENKWSKNGFGEPCPRQGGKFTREETETVRRAVEEYCALKNISTARLCSECDHKAELKGAWMEIAKRLPHRTVQSVYRHGLRQLHPFKRGPWTEAECEALIDHVNRSGKKWSTIQSKLNRSADSCRDKYREMNSEFVKGRWKEGETEILKRLIREHLRADPNADIKELGKMVEREGIIIPWSTISKRMTKRSRLSCFKKWQKMTGLYSPSDQHKGQPGGTTAPGDAQPAVAVVTDQPVASVPQAESAGAAAAAAAKQPPVANPMDLLAGASTTTTTTTTTTGAAPTGSEMTREYDIFLLQSVISSGQVSDDSQGRWKVLVEEWQEAETDESLFNLPLPDMAKIILERKQQEGDAKMAADAVDKILTRAV